MRPTEIQQSANPGPQDQGRKICFCFQNISSTDFLCHRKHLPDKASDVIPVALLPTGRGTIMKVVRTQKNQHTKLSQDSADNQCK